MRSLRLLSITSIVFGASLATVAAISNRLPIVLLTSKWDSVESSPQCSNHFYAAMLPQVPEHSRALHPGVSTCKGGYWIYTAVDRTGSEPFVVVLDGRLYVGHDSFAVAIDFPALECGCPTDKFFASNLRGSFLLNRVAVVVLIIGFTGRLGLVVYRYRRRRQGDCDICGYSLRGITSTQCPECGSIIDNPVRDRPVERRQKGTSLVHACRIATRSDAAPPNPRRPKPPPTHRLPDSATPRVHATPPRAQSKIKQHTPHVITVGGGPMPSAQRLPPFTYHSSLSLCVLCVFCGHSFRLCRSWRLRGLVPWCQKPNGRLPNQRRKNFSPQTRIAVPLQRLALSKTQPTPRRDPKKAGHLPQSHTSNRLWRFSPNKRGSAGPRPQVLPCQRVGIGNGSGTPEWNGDITIGRITRRLGRRVAELQRRGDVGRASRARDLWGSRPTAAVSALSPPAPVRRGSPGARCGSAPRRAAAGFSQTGAPPRTRWPRNARPPAT